MKVRIKTIEEGAQPENRLATFEVLRMRKDDEVQSLGGLKSELKNLEINIAELAITLEEKEGRRETVKEQIALLEKELNHGQH